MLFGKNQTSLLAGFSARAVCKVLRWKMVHIGILCGNRLVIFSVNQLIFENKDQQLRQSRQKPVADLGESLTGRNFIKCLFHMNISNMDSLYHGVNSMLIHFSRDYGFFSISSLLDENLIFLKKLSMLLKACTLTKKKILSNSIYLMQKLNLEYQILKHGKKDYQCLDAFINLFRMIISIIKNDMTLYVLATLQSNMIFFSIKLITSILSQNIC